MIRTAFFESIPYRLFKVFSTGYENSRTKKALDKISFWASESFINRSFVKYVQKNDDVSTSLYKKMMDKIGEALSKPASALHNFFSGLLAKSFILGKYTDFLKSSDKRDSLSVFFATLFASFAGVMIIAGSFLGCALCVVVAVCSFFLIRSDKVARLFNSSFFMGIIRDLIK